MQPGERRLGASPRAALGSVGGTGVARVCALEFGAAVSGHPVRRHPARIVTPVKKDIADRYREAFSSTLSFSIFSPLIAWGQRRKRHCPRFLARNHEC